MDNSKSVNKQQIDNQSNKAQSKTGDTTDNTIKNPDEWTTGNEEMTGAQRSYLKTLSDEAGVEMDDALTKADASKHIDELQHKTGRGLNDNK